MDFFTMIYNFSVLGLLIGIIWTLRYILQLEKKIEHMDRKIELMISKVQKEIKH
jgi:hypothetical protein